MLRSGASRSWVPKLELGNQNKFCEPEQILERTRRMRESARLLAIAIFGWLITAQAASAEPGDAPCPPNVLLIMTDDT